MTTTNKPSEERVHTGGHFNSETPFTSSTPLGPQSSGLNSQFRGAEAARSEEPYERDDELAIPLPPDSDVAREELGEEPRSIILAMLSQVTKGMDLHRIAFPTFVLEPRSMLERITDFMTHPQLILGYETFEGH